MATASLATRAERSTLRSLVGTASVLLSLWVALAGAVFGVTAAAFDWCAAGGGFNNFVLCLYTPEYSGLWAPIWIDAPVGTRDVVFALAMALVVAPTLWAFLAPCVRTTTRMLHCARRHLSGPWRY